MATIIFNGKTYNSIEEMTEQERNAYEQMMNIFVDANGNGVPDFLEGDMIQNLLRINSTKLEVSGQTQTYHNLDELPPELRQQVDRAFQTMSKFGVIPGVPTELQMKPSLISNEPAQSKPFISENYSPAIQEGNKSSALQWILLGALLFFCVVAIALATFFFLQQ